MPSEPAGRQNGLAIRFFRKKELMATAQLAACVGLSEQGLRNIENGSKPASDEVISAIARTLGVPTGAITRDGKEVPVACTL